MFTLRHCNPVRAAEQKTLRFVGDTKSNPVCAVPEKAKCKQQIRYASVQSGMKRSSVNSESGTLWFKIRTDVYVLETF